MDLEEEQKTFDKLIVTAKKSGFRDGVDEGRKSVFQEGFNKGYEEGFRIGFASGFYKGSLLAQNKEQDSLLVATRKGWCKLCEDKEILNKSLEETLTIQKNHSNNLLEGLQLKYANVIEFPAKQ